MNEKHKKLLDWLSTTKDGVLESQIIAAGLSSTLNDLILLGYPIEAKSHPTVKDQDGSPATVFSVRK